MIVISLARQHFRYRIHDIEESSKTKNLQNSYKGGKTVRAGKLFKVEIQFKKGKNYHFGSKNDI